MIIILLQAQLQLDIGKLRCSFDKSINDKLSFNFEKRFQNIIIMR